MATQLPFLPEVERLSSIVIRILGGNPGKFTLQGTNTYLVGTGPRRLLIDTGDGQDSWLKALQKTLKEENATISDTILTHWHGDHVGGIKQVKSIIPDVKFHKYKREDDDPTVKEDIQHELVDGQLLSVEGARLKTVYSPGHAVDHVALILQEENAMFTGDNVLGHGTAVFEDLSLYLSSLEKMRKIWIGEKGVKSPRAYPGHGAVIGDGPGKISEYISHRKQREDEVIALLKTKRPGSGERSGDASNEDQDDEWTSRELVKIIYKDVPESLHLPAEMGVIQILMKLQDEGKVEEVANHSSKWRLKGREKL